MAESIHFLGQEIPVRRRAFQKRLGLSVYPNGQIRVSANKTISQREILKFLEAQKAWVQKALAESESLKAQYPPKTFSSGELFPYLGRNYQLEIRPGTQASLQFTDDKILFFSPKPESEWSEEIRNSYFQMFKKSYFKVAEKIMSQRIRYWSARMQLQPKAVQFRRQNSIWGSCSPENKISLNLKLVVAPIEVIDYVLIHELAHIQHKNHSQRFWNLVEQFTPHRYFSRDWLKDHHFDTDFLSRRSELSP